MARTPFAAPPRRQAVGPLIQLPSFQSRRERVDAVLLIHSLALDGKLAICTKGKGTTGGRPNERRKPFTHRDYPALKGMEMRPWDIRIRWLYQKLLHQRDKRQLLRCQQPTRQQQRQHKYEHKHQPTPLPQQEDEAHVYRFFPTAHLPSFARHCPPVLLCHFPYLSEPPFKMIQARTQIPPIHDT